MLALRLGIDTRFLCALDRDTDTPLVCSFDGVIDICSLYALGGVLTHV